MYDLRPYQRTAVHKFFQEFGPGTKHVAVIATGGGKTLVAAEIAARMEGKTLFLAHREELLGGMRREMNAFAPHMSLGVVKGQEHQINADIILGSVQTVSRPNRLARLPQDLALIIIDEVHHANAGTYKRILENFPNTPVLGLTATLPKWEFSDWHEICREDILDLINDGYLCDIRGKKVLIDGMSLREATMSHGDFTGSSLTDILLSADAPKFAVDAYKAEADDRQGIVFVPTVQAVHAFTEAFQGGLYKTAGIIGDMDRDVRRNTLDAFRRGDIQVLVNCMVLTEGVDLPNASCAVIARPTTSEILYAQMVGRITRRAPKKTDGLVLDLVGATEMHSLANLAGLTSQRLPNLNDGESMLEAATRWKKSRHPALHGYIVQNEQVDIFGQRSLVWLATHKGIWFLPYGDNFVFLWPGKEEGTYSVGVRSSKRKGGEWLIENVPFDLAIQSAEIHVNLMEVGFGLSKRAEWRRKPASEGQKLFADRIDIGYVDGIRRGELSDLIEVKVVSGILDRAL